MIGLVLIGAILPILAGSPEGSQPYLTAQTTPDLTMVLPPPPAAGSPLDRADRAVFTATRRLRSSPRWSMAAADVHRAPFDTFACGIGLKLTPELAPALNRVLTRFGDAGAVNRVKMLYHRRRPYLGTKAAICEPQTKHLAENGDYPSGHAANGWATALILTEIFPERATQILTRGRAFAESRIICGSHSVSAEQAGLLSGSAIVAAAHGSPAFRTDMEAAQREAASLRARADLAIAPGQCAGETKLNAERLPSQTQP